MLPLEVLGSVLCVSGRESTHPCFDSYLGLRYAWWLSHHSVFNIQMCKNSFSRKKLPKQLIYNVLISYTKSKHQRSYRNYAVDPSESDERSNL